MQEELFELYKACDVFVFPTLGDGFGFVIPEALSFGLPCVCSKNSAGEDIIKDGFNGYTYPAGDSAALDSIIENIISCPEQLSKMAENVSRTASEYTWLRYHETIAKEVCRIIDDRRKQEKRGTE